MEYEGACADRPGEEAFLTGYAAGLQDKRADLVTEMRMLQLRLSGAVPRSEVDTVMQRGMIVQAESQRMGTWQVWVDQRLRVLTQRVRY